MQEFLSVTSSVDEMLVRLRKYVLFDLLDVYPELRFRDPDDLIQVMKDIRTLCNQYKRNFEETRAWYDGYELVRINYGKKTKMHDCVIEKYRKD